MGSQRKTVTERFWSLVPDQPGLDCWEWTGNRSWNGYGMLHVGKTNKRAHRLAYQFCCGEIPPDKEVCHACDNRLCVNPSHLWLGTRTDNMRDARDKGRLYKNGHPATECVRGHFYSEENTRHRPNGGRSCVECNRIRVRKRQQRIRDEARALRVSPAPAVSGYARHLPSATSNRDR